MPDFRELFDNPEEAFRAMFGGLQRHLHTAMVSRVTEASADGHTLQAQPVIQQQIQDPTLTQTMFQDHPPLLDVPVHFPGGAGTVLTHGIAEGDEILSVFASRALDTWHQNGGTAVPVSDRIHSLSDAVAIPGVRSDPRKLQQVDTQAAHLRSEDKTAVHEVHPTNGVQTFHADPSTAPASASFDPLTMAATFYRHVVQSATGILGSATSGSTTHTHGVSHGAGAFMSAFTSAGTNFVRAHPVLGSILSALDGQHSVTAGLGGVTLQSATSISMACPPGGLSLPSGGVSASALASGAASQNVGPVSGDLSGSLPSPTVTGILHVVGADALPVAANDAAAAALTPPVPVGALYRNGSALMVRVA